MLLDALDEGGELLLGGEQHLPDHLAAAQVELRQRLGRARDGLLRGGGLQLDEAALLGHRALRRREDEVVAAPLVVVEAELGQLQRRVVRLEQALHLLRRLAQGLAAEGEGPSS